MKNKKRLSLVWVLGILIVLMAVTYRTYQVSMNMAMNSTARSSSPFNFLQFFENFIGSEGPGNPYNESEKGNYFLNLLNSIFGQKGSFNFNGKGQQNLNSATAANRSAPHGSNGASGANGGSGGNGSNAGGPGGAGSNGGNNSSNGSGNNSAGGSGTDASNGSSSSSNGSSGSGDTSGTNADTSSSGSGDTSATNADTSSSGSGDTSATNADTSGSGSGDTSGTNADTSSSGSGDTSATNADSGSGSTSGSSTGGGSGSGSGGGSGSSSGGDTGPGGFSGCVQGCYPGCIPGCDPECLPPSCILSTASTSSLPTINAIPTDADIAADIAAQNQESDALAALIASREALVAPIIQQAQASKFQTIFYDTIPVPSTDPTPADVPAKIASKQYSFH